MKDISICSLGIMGVEYVRNIAVPDVIEAPSNGSTDLFIDNIFAQQTIGNVLDIHLRQNPDKQLSWVTIRQASPTQVMIEAQGVDPGDYQLTLQSFDNNGKVFSTLKEDTITIRVIACAISSSTASEIQAELDKRPIELTVGEHELKVVTSSFDHRL